MRIARLSLGMTLQQVADKCGVSRQEVSAWELGRRAPNPRRFLSISQALKLDPLIIMEKFSEEQSVIASKSNA